MDKRVMKQFLKSGFIYQNKLFPTDTGSPQGGAISSLYANMALDGLEKVIQDKYHKNSKGNIENHYRAKTKVNLVRYADDFIITANSKEIAEELKVIVSKFLSARGLMLSEEKTVITHIDNGFDFLGWTFRKFKGKLIVKPSKRYWVVPSIFALKVYCPSVSFIISFSPAAIVATFSLFT